MISTLTDILWQSWLVLGRMGPYLLFGFLMAGLLSILISPEFVERHLGRRGRWPVLKAAALGVPLPLCSCSVIPVSASIRRHGASRGATAAFLLSTPQTGLDSIAITYALLGPIFAVFRPVAALATGVLGGYLVQWFDKPDGDADAGTSEFEAYQQTSLADKQTRGRWLRALQYGLITLPRDIGAALLVGVVIAGAIAALVPQGELASYLGPGILSILLMMAVGVPIYVCATASVPIAVGFMHVGASPGAALAFLIAGPATNAATFTTIWKLLGRRTAVLYLVTIAASAIGGGLFLDWLGPVVTDSIPKLASHVHDHAMVGWATHAGAIVLLAVLAMSYAVPIWQQKKRRHRMSHEHTAPDQQRVELSIAGMTCGHCAQSVQRALLACEGVASADVDQPSGRAVVVGDRLDTDQLSAAVARVGYTATIAANKA